MDDLSGNGGAPHFFLFAGLSIIALAYFQRQVPETKNRSPQDIERELDLPESHDYLRRPMGRTHLWDGEAATNLGADIRLAVGDRSGSGRTLGP